MHFARGLAPKGLDGNQVAGDPWRFHRSGPRPCWRFQHGKTALPARVNALTRADYAG